MHVFVCFDESVCFNWVFTVCWCRSWLWLSSNENCDGRYVGGAEENGSCSVVFDGGSTTSIDKDEHGCFVISADSNCLPSYEMGDGRKDMGKDLGVDMAAELFNCQSSASDGQTCASPKDPSIFCCPITAASCDGRYMGGTAINGHCTQEADGYGTGFVGRDENGCFYVQAAESCFLAPDMTQDMTPLNQDM